MLNSTTVLSIILGSIIGALVSWLIAHIYWKLNAPVERVVKELKDVLPHYLHPLRYPQFYTHDVMKVEAEQEVPKESDIPRVTHAVFSKKDIRDGDKVEVLLHLLDLGRNLENPDGISVKDHFDRDCPVLFAGLGLACFEFTANKTDGKGSYRLTVNLKDTARNTNSQTFIFTIKP